jgi:hypothetical protein
VTIFRANGLRFLIYTDAPEPTHVHVYVYGDGEARIDIVELAVISKRGLKRRDLAVALSIVQQHRHLFLQTWEDIHGRIQFHRDAI